VGKRRGVLDGEKGRVKGGKKKGGFGW